MRSCAWAAALPSALKLAETAGAFQHFVCTLNPVLERSETPFWNGVKQLPFVAQESRTISAPLRNGVEGKVLLLYAVN